MGNKRLEERWYDGFYSLGREASFKIGFGLDLDEGTLDVYKNDQRLGTMRNRLVGEYCWVVSLKLFGAQFSVSIGR